MHPAQAWSRGWHVLARYPWVALIPLGWNVGQMLLAYAGIPLGPAMDAGRAVDPTFGWVGLSDAGLALLPSWLPGVEDLQVPLQPESVALAVGVAPGMQWAGLLLVPLLHALAQGLFLALLAQAVAAGSVGLRNDFRVALTALPALFALHLGWRLAVMTLSEGWLVGLAAAWLLLYPLLPVSIAAGNRPLTRALSDAPGALWGQLGGWVGLGWRALLAAVLFALGWSLMGRPLVLALLVYPFLGTWIVAAAVALYVGELSPAARPAAASDGRAWRAWALALAAAPILVALGAWLGAQWAGYRASREAVFPDPFPPYVAYVRQEGDRELVLYRTDQGLGIAELERGRFGWRRFWSIDGTPGSSWVPGRPAAPATIHWERPHPSYGRFLVWGELHDTQVAFLEVAGERFAVGQGSPLFLIQVAEVPEYGPGGLQNLRLLDASGRAVLPDEGAEP